MIKRMYCLICLLLILLPACVSNGARLDSGLFTNKPCQAPCWNNLTPGQSTASDVDQFINGLNKNEWPAKDTRDYESNCKVTAITDKTSTEANSLVRFFIDKDKLTLILSFHDNMPNLKQITDYYGPPEYIKALHVIGPDGDFYSLDIYYPRQGLAFNVSPNQRDLGFIKPGMQVSDIQYFKPGDLLSYLSITYSCYLDQDKAALAANEEIARIRPWSGFGPVSVIETR